MVAPSCLHNRGVVQDGTLNRIYGTLHPILYVKSLSKGSMDTPVSPENCPSTGSVLKDYMACVKDWLFKSHFATLPLLCPLFIDKPLPRQSHHLIIFLRSWEVEIGQSIVKLNTFHWAPSVHFIWDRSRLPQHGSWHILELSERIFPLIRPSCALDLSSAFMT